MSEKTGRAPHPSMTVWQPLTGRWVGTNRLWLSREDPEENSPAHAGVTISEDGRQLEIDYSWTHQERRQTAVLTALLRGDGKAEVRWSDTFHTSVQRMNLKGTCVPSGIVSVKTFYEVSKKEVWSWRILLDPTGARSFKVAMYNVDPKGKEELAVEIVFRRPA